MDAQTRRGDISSWAEETFHCEQHGFHSGLVCSTCYDVQVERVERESAPLREANTSEALRKRALASRAERNGE